MQFLKYFGAGVIFLACILIPNLARSQTSNILENGGFEANWSGGLYPSWNSTLYTNCPYPWLDFNPQGQEAWVSDSVWIMQNQNEVDPEIQNGFYSNGYFNSESPFSGTGSTITTMTLQPAYEGKCYVGFDASTNLSAKEGIQQKMFDTPCYLNSGDYVVNLYASRVFYGTYINNSGSQNTKDSKVKSFLSANSSSSEKEIGNWTLNPSNFVTGDWNQLTNSFTLNISNSNHQNLRWFSITGVVGFDSNLGTYTWIDDAKLYRQCDIDNRCYAGQGQLCPEVFTPTAPNSLLRARNISNATKVEVWLYDNSVQEVFHVVHENRNGMPDFSLSRLHLPATMATAYYNYKMQISNDCGGREFTGQIHVQDTALYNLYPVWEDTAANWTQAPIPCCVQNLYLQNTQIVGDVDFIVQDQIIVSNGVSVAPGSHVLLQAGQVVELTNVEFDGTNSTVDIVELPCPSRSACGSGTNEMVINNGVVQQPENTELAENSSQAYEINPAFQDLAESFIKKPIESPQIELSVFPNPFEQEFTLAYRLNEDMKVSIQILDLQMRPVKMLLKDELQVAGTHELKSELKALAAGIFFVQFEANGQRIYERIVKQ